MPEGNPFARVLLGKLLIPAGSAAPGQARLEFNVALRQFSALFVMLYVVMVCGTAAMSMIVERERDTWQSLIATSLTPWEILRAKMLAAIWRAREAGLMLIALWTVGLAGGCRPSAGFPQCRRGPDRDRSVLRGAGGLSVFADRRTETNRPHDPPRCSVRAALERAGDPVAGRVRASCWGPARLPFSSGRRCSLMKTSSPWSARACFRNSAGRASNPA